MNPYLQLAKKYIPGGVNSPVRSFNSVGGEPFFVTHAKDCYLYDTSAKEYIDYVCSWGANIVGHANSEVVKNVSVALTKGFSYGTSHLLEIEFAQKICELMPSIEKIRMVSSGTEATMTAIRLARGYTKRNYIIKFNGCYHGHSDALLAKAGSGLLSFKNSTNSGIPSVVTEHTIVLEYNSLTQLEAAFSHYNKLIAAVIIEPIAGNMNLILPQSEFLNSIVELCKISNTLLIFDEVMTGFRVALGGAQKLYNIVPDITILGKVIGGGMPLAALGGRAAIMDFLSPDGPVYQAGTLSGNPIALTCGLTNLAIITQAEFYPKLNQLTQRLINGLTISAKNHDIAFSAQQIGGLWGFYFSVDIPTTLSQIQALDQNLYQQFFHLMLNQGIFLPPSMFEAGFICSAHSDDVIDCTINKATKAFKQMELAKIKSI